MDLKEQQRILDERKWFDSLEAGEDKCGAYPFCQACDKALSYPCARAFLRKEKKFIRIAIVRKKRSGEVAR